MHRNDAVAPEHVRLFVHEMDERLFVLAENFHRIASRSTRALHAPHESQKFFAFI